jgi:hypothetical protein
MSRKTWRLISPHLACHCASSLANGGLIIVKLQNARFDFQPVL